MIIDLHTHIFPEKIAEKALGKLSSIIQLTPSFNGCAQGLRDSMEKAGIDISIVLPVVTDPKQFDSILRFSSYINETYSQADSHRLISFGGIHPAAENCKEQLQLLKREGFRGIKIHPNYQGLDFDDIRTKRFLADASEIGIPVLVHTGFDPYTPDHEYCTPDMILNVLEDVQPKDLILAHMGGNMNYDEVEEKLCGRDVYLDTAYSIFHMEQEQFVRMVRKHGADKIFFASDCPWADQKACVDILQGSALTPEEKDMIFFGNAQKLLHV